MAGENTAVTLSALFKEVYAPELLNHVPDAAMLVKELKFSGVETTTGGNFVQPVVLTREHGFTYASSDDDAFSLNGASAMTVKRATLLGSQLVGQGQLGYEAAARASKGKAAFAEATELLVENMIESASYRLEQSFLYGQSGVGVVQTTTGAAPTAIRISAASWAPTTWAGIEGAKLSIVDPTFATIRALNAVVQSVNMDEDDTSNYRTITFTGALPGVVTAGDLVFFGGAITGTVGGAATKKECLGLNGILATASGSLFGIPVTGAGSSPLWRGNLYNVGGTLTVTKILNAAKRARDKGLKEPAKLLVSPKAWLDLVNPTMDPAANSGNGPRRLDASYSAKKVEFGTESIVIHGPQGQNIEVVPHAYVREGDAFLVPFKVMKRVGASDIDFKTPGMPAEEMLIDLQSTPAYEFRCYANQALFIDAPAKCVKLYGIT